jgi:hypothetical protein
MQPDRHGAHAEAIEIGGKTYHVRRDFDLAIRIEERCGPFSDILRAIVDGNRQVARLPVKQIAAVFEEALRGQVSRAEIEAHIMRVGPLRAMVQVAKLIENFFVGDERFRERLEALRESGDAPDPRMAASSPGPSYLERPQN